ncbi:MAG: tetratricopeptide repeat protein [Methylomonas sp.]|jgi:tetratricopeptide (TPR) repeat protein
MKSKSVFVNKEALLQQAFLTYQSGRLAEAAALFKNLLKAFPKDFQLLTTLGTIELRLGNYDQGAALLKRSLKIQPNQPDAISDYGTALILLKRLDEALAVYDKAIAANPGYIKAHYYRGNVLIELQRLDEAVESFDRMVALDPDFAGAYNNRGVVLKDMGRQEEALASYEQALALQPNYPEAHNNRGLALHELKRYEAALASYDRALACKPDYANAYYNIGNTLQEMGRPEDAMSNYERAIALKGDHASAIWNKAILKLQAGDFVEGWRLYEWRWRKSPSAAQTRYFSKPRWLGEPVAGKTVLIYPEQGLGDFIQFCRYAPLLETLGAKVIIEAPAELFSLIATLKGDFTLLKAGDKSPAFDLHCPVMNFPRAFGTTLADIPAATPYLYADSEKAGVWKARLGGKSQPRIGLVWSGSSAHKNDHDRSMPFKFLAPLLSLPFEFHALQKEIRPDEADELRHFPQLRIHGRELEDFSDTAALMHEMDHIISVDTSVAHLAGAMGKPVWILLGLMPDYRWLLDRADSPWYPTAKLFRQSETGGWSCVIADLVQDLKTER